MMRRAKDLNPPQQYTNNNSNGSHEITTLQSAPSKGKGKKKHQKNRANGSKTASSVSAAAERKLRKTAEELEDDFELQVIELKRMLCRGIVRFIVALR